MPELVFIHGFGGCSAHWDGVIELLDGSLAATAIDLPGHGRNGSGGGPFSIQKAVRHIAENVVAEDVILVGHSMGTRVALEVQSLLEDRIHSLVLADGSCVPGDANQVRRDLELSLSVGSRENVQRDIFGSFLIERLSDEQRSALLRHMDALPLAAIVDYWSDMASWDTKRFPILVKNISYPVQILQSTNIADDPLAERQVIADQPKSLWLNVWRTTPSAHITPVPDCGHYLMIERPDVVAAAIVRALESRN